MAVKKGDKLRMLHSKITYIKTVNTGNTEPSEFYDHFRKCSKIKALNMSKNIVVKMEFFLFLPKM